MFAGVDSAQSERLKSAGAVLLLHVLMGYAFLFGLGVELVRRTSEPLKLVEILPVPQPAEVPQIIPQKARSEAEEGKASPENLHSQPTEIMAPLPEIELPKPPPITVAPVAGTGVESDAGASNRRGPGSGAGGIGNGLGSGGGGRGTGSGIGSEARLVRGRIVHADYPRSAVLDGAGGNVVARLTVGPDGRVQRCTIARSSGHPALDETTCRLIQRRFRFEPARNLEGRPIASTFGWQQHWWLERD
jgi:periplasmic protein TonB